MAERIAKENKAKRRADARAKAKLKAKRKEKEFIDTDIMPLKPGWEDDELDRSIKAEHAEEVKALEAAFEEGRVAFNTFITSVNSGVGASLLVTVPTVSQALKGEGYPRSKRLYTQLLKDAALCRNRGGEALAGLWGNLMVYGTVPGVNPCGNAAEKYYSQGM